MLMLALLSPSEFSCHVFAIVGVLIVVVVSISWAVHQRKASRQAVEEAVRPYGGTLDTPAGSWLTQEQASFTLLDTPVRLTWHPGSKNSPACTRLEFGLVSRGVLRVRPEGLFATVTKWFGAQDIVLGDPDFDELFLIEGKPETFVKSALTSGARRAIGNWVQSRVLLHVQPGQMIFQVGAFLPPSVQQLTEFIEDAKTVLAGVKGYASGETGVKVLEVVLKEGDCPTCGAPLSGALSVCAKCGTQQHADCWNYLGKCATYACGSLRRK